VNNFSQRHDIQGTHIESARIGPGFSSLSPHRRMRRDGRVFLGRMKCERGVKKESEE
jgi:hypothetical protein